MRRIACIGILLAAHAKPDIANAVTADLVFCSERPDKAERLACYEAAARLGGAHNNTRNSNTRQVTKPRTSSPSTVVEPKIVAVSAPASDAYAKSMAPIAPTTTVTNATNWSGCYLGVHAGGSLLYDTFTEENGGGAIAGGQAGCNYQIGRIVPGVEVNGSWSSARSNSFEETNAVGLFVNTTRAFQNRWAADISLRLGLAATDQTLIYAKVGGAVAKFDWSQSSVFSAGDLPLSFSSTRS